MNANATAEIPRLLLEENCGQVTKFLVGVAEKKEENRELIVVLNAVPKKFTQKTYADIAI